MFALDRNQQKVTNTRGNLLITACPGSGKTSVLSAKASALLNEGNSVVGAVTFTRDSAKELESRIKSQCTTVPGNRLFVGTFHSLILRQLKTANIQMKPISEMEAQLVIRSVLARIGMTVDNKNINRATDVLAFAKSRLANTFEPNGFEERLLAGYQAELAKMQVNDFADILLAAVQLMQSNDLQPLPIDFLLVDESQDSDPVQLEWIGLHVKAGCEVMLVGDEDQSIFHFRNAQGWNGMKSFQKKSSATHVSLDINYRCCPIIIDHATKLIAKNKNRGQKTIVAYRTDIGHVRTIKAINSEHEAKDIVALVESEKGTWGILARTNFALDETEFKLQAQGIPYKRMGGHSFWDIKIVATFYSILTSLSKHDNNRGWLTALNWAELPGNVIDIIVDAVSQSGKVSWNGFRHAINDERVRTTLSSNQKLLNALSSLSAKQAGWQQSFADGRIKIGLAGVLSWVITTHPLHKESKTTNNLEMLDKDLSFLKMVEKTIDEMKHPTLKERLHMIFIKQIMECKRNKESAERVKLMTVHSSKGLEFDNVVILGCGKERFPLKVSDLESDEAEEERRLFYVAMTRACNNLYISYSALDKPSAFIAEAGLTI